MRIPALFDLRADEPPVDERTVLVTHTPVRDVRDDTPVAPAVRAVEIELESLDSRVLGA